MNYLASHSIPIEFGLSTTMKKRTKEVNSFAHPLGLLMDNHLAVSLCSFRGILNPLSRSQELSLAATQCGMAVDKVVTLLSNGFRHNFQPISVRNKLMSDFKKEIEEVLQQRNFQFLYKVHYMPKVPRREES